MSDGPKSIAGVPVDVMRCIEDREHGHSSEVSDWCDAHSRCGECAHDVFERMSARIACLIDDLDAARDKILRQRNDLALMKNALVERNNGVLKKKYRDKLSKMREDLTRAREIALKRYDEASEAQARLADAENELAVLNAKLAAFEANGGDAWATDANGVRIEIGDRLEWTNGKFTASELRLSTTGWTTWDSDHGYEVEVGKCRHADMTVEDVLRSFLGECECAIQYGYDAVPQEVFDDYAKRLRMAGE